jgi:hypothetical protein
MATFTPQHNTLDKRTREAWSAYRDGLTDLRGREYDTAESESWDRLQGVLRTIETDRAAAHTDGDTDA